MCVVALCQLVLGSMARRGATLIPLVSGYREEETGKLILTTSHAGALRASHAPPERSLVVIPASEIVSARHLDPGAYSHFQTRKNDAKPATT